MGAPSGPWRSQRGALPFFSDLLGEVGGAALTVILNPAAGSGRVAEGRIVQVLRAAGLQGRVLAVRPESLASAVRAAASAGDLVGVAGGDGSLSTAAGILAGTDAALVPFPIGTLNHFARRLGITSLEDAARAAADGRVLSIPLGSVAGRIFINHASAGVYPRMVRERELLRRWSGKRFATVLASAHQLLRLEARPIGLSVDGTKSERTAPGIWVALEGGFQLPVDGKLLASKTLEVVVPEIHGRARFLMKGMRALWLMRRGRSVQHAGVEVIRTQRFTLEADESVDLSRDGEVERAEPPLEFCVHPEVLKVVARSGIE